jgi:hypothetical protein
MEVRLANGKGSQAQGIVKGRNSSEDAPDTIQKVR